jgi:hypothetical protein
MNIAIGSAFRNSAGRLQRYTSQVDAFRRFLSPDYFVRVIAAVGDCVDNTYCELRSRMAVQGIPTQFVKCDHGGPVFGSTEEQARMDALTVVGNAILGGVNATDDILVYVESDLVWDAYTIKLLVDMVAGQRGGFDVVSPLIFAGPHFYDIYAFRKDGVRFSPFPPYHSDLNPYGLTEVDSTGSCLVMRADVARTVRMPPGGVLIGWCNQARAQGYRIGVTSELRVTHP